MSNVTRIEELEKTVLDNTLGDFAEVLKKNITTGAQAEDLIFTLRDSADLLTDLIGEYDPGTPPSEESLLAFWKDCILLSTLHDETFKKIKALKVPLMECIYGEGNWS